MSLTGRVTIYDFRFSTSNDQWAFRIDVAARAGTLIEMPLGRIVFADKDGYVEIRYVWNGEASSLGSLATTEFI